MFKINLVPEVQEQKNKIRRANTTSVTVSVVIVAASVAVLILLSLALAALSVQIGSTDKRIASVEKESEQYKELEETVISLEKGLAGIKEITDGKNKWTTLLAHLENATPGDVQYKNLSLKAGVVTAELKGRDMSSLARFVESYKQYKVISLSGSGQPSENLAVTIDGNQSVLTKVKSTGNWTYAINFDPASDHRIEIKSGNDSTTATYTAATKKLETNGNVSATVKNLFTAVETKEYRKDGQNVNFEASFNYDGSVIW